MIQVILKRIVGLLFAATLGLPLLAQTTNYVIATTPGTNIGALASEYGFSIVKSAQSNINTLTSIATAAPWPAATIVALKSESGVIGVEVNSVAQSPENSPASQFAANSNSSTNLFATASPVSFYGNTVLSAYVTQPSAQLIELGGAQTRFGGGAGVVAIIDTGVDTEHPGLRGALLPGYDFTRNRPDTVSELYDVNQDIANALHMGNLLRESAGVGTPILSQSTVELLDQSTVELLDQSTVELLDGQNLPGGFGHGTMMAGLVHLVAPQAQIMPLKAFRADGTANLADIVSAILYAADHGADVINMSFGFPTSSPLLVSAIAYAENHGIFCVTSAGNQAARVLQYPAAYPGVIGVGSTSLLDQRSSFSSFGADVNIAAPGEGLITFFPGGLYAAGWGTSFSTALVSGAAALISGLNPSMTFFGFSTALAQGVPIDPTMGLGKARLNLVASGKYFLPQ
jgi:subtilisin family serine protease